MFAEFPDQNLGWLNKPFLWLIALPVTLIGSYICGETFFLCGLGFIPMYFGAHVVFGTMRSHDISILVKFLALLHIGCVLAGFGAALLTNALVVHMFP